MWGFVKELAEWIKKNQDSLNEFDRLLREEKYLKIPEIIRDYDGLIAGIILPSLNHLRQFARIYLMKGQNAIYNHDSQAAFKAYLASHRPLEYALDDHFVISSLVGMAIEAIRLDQLKVLVESNMLSEKQIKLIMSQLQHDMNLWSKLFDISMFSNAVFVIDTITFISRPANEYMLFETGYFSKETDYRKMEDEFFDFNEYLLKFFLAPVISVYSEDLLYAVDCLILEAQHPLPPEYSKLNNNIPAKFLLSKLVLVDLSTMFYKKVVMIRSQQQAAVMGLGVELYRRKYGKLPESLDSLVPEFIDKVYIDQFSGQPFKYIKGKYQLKLYDYRKGYFPENKAELFEVQGYNIYSVGINERDDGGVYDKIDHRNHDDQGFSFIEKIGSLKH